MRKNLIAALVTLGLGAAAAAAIVGTNAFAQAPSPAPGMPMLLAQAGPPARGPAARGPNAARALNRPAPTAAERTARRDAMCQDRYARATGRFAYLETRLELTAPQSAAFARWRTVRLDAARRQAAACAARPVLSPAQPRPMPASPVERMTREQDMLQQRLSDIQAERPALEALYDVLTPAQREIFGRRPAGMRGRMVLQRRGMMPGMGGRGPMGRGPMGPDGRGQDRQGPPSPRQP